MLQVSEHINNDSTSISINVPVLFANAAFVAILSQEKRII